MRNQPKRVASALYPVRMDSAPSFLEMVRTQYKVESLDRSTRACMLISIDQAVRELSGPGWRTSRVAATLVRLRQSRATAGGPRAGGLRATAF